MRTPLRRLLGATLALLSIVPSVPAAAAPPVDPALAARFRSIIERSRERHTLAGITAAVILPDGSTWTGAAGWADIAKRVPMRPSTPVAIGSITKTFVASAILELAEEGRLSLDDPLSRFVDWPGGARITIRQLLSHTSGLFDYFMVPTWESLVFGRPRHHWSVGEILGLVRRPYFAPGRGYAYSNTNYVLLGRVLRRVTGHRVSTVLRNRFLRPLGLRRTVFQGEERIPFVAAKGYLRSGSRWIGWSDGTRHRPSTSAATVAWAAGAILSTPLDTARWGRALYGGRVLAPASLAAMETVNPFEPYGLGARRFDLPGGRVAWGHTGSLRGTVSYLFHLPAEGITVVLFTNRGRVILTGTVEALIAQALRASGLPVARSAAPRLS